MTHHHQEMVQPQPHPDHKDMWGESDEAATTRLLHSKAARTGLVALTAAGALLISHGVAIFTAYGNGIDHGKDLGHQEYLAGDQKRALAMVECVFMADAHQENPGLYAEAILSSCIESSSVTTVVTSSIKQGG